MRYLLDTNAVISAMKGEAGFSRNMRSRRPSGIGVPSIVFHELFYGACKSARRGENVERLLRLRFEIVPFDEDDARHAGEIRAALNAVGLPIGPYDVLIAGQARARELTLITHNVGEFSRVEDLSIEDWLGV